MDKDEDYEIYRGQLRPEVNPLHKRKVILSRAFKLSSPLADIEYGKIGAELLKAGQFQQSVFPLKRALIIISYINYFTKRHLIGLVRALFQLEKENEAFSSIKRALSRQPHYRDLHELLVDTLEEKHRLEDLRSFYQEMIKALSHSKMAATLYFEGAETLVMRNMYPQAFEMYKRAIETNTEEDPHYHNQYAMALYHEGFFEEAIVQFEHAMRINPKDHLSCNNIAYLHYSLGRIERAREKYEGIIENGLEMYNTYPNFILLLSHIGEDEEVIEKYKALFIPYIQTRSYLLLETYKEALRITEVLLQRDDIDAEIREFNTKKLKGINLILSMLN